MIDEESLSVFVHLVMLNIQNSIKKQ